MQAAPTHTIPVYLFELQNGEDTLHGDGSETSTGPGELSGRHSAADLRQFVGESKEPFKECGIARGGMTACGDTSDRFGPGRLSRRQYHTKRLRELRARRSTDPVHSLRSRTHVSRGSSGGKELPKTRTDGAAFVSTLGSNKRRRASSGEACQLESQRLPPEYPAASVQPVLQQPEPPTFEPMGGGGRPSSAVRHPLRSRDDFGSIEPVTEKNQTPGTAAKDGGNWRRVNVSMVPLGPLDEGPSLGSDSKNTVRASDQPSTIKSCQILPVRSAPASRRPVVGRSHASGALSSGGRKTTPQKHEKDVQQRIDSTASAAAGEAKGIATAAAAGETVAVGWESAVPRNDEHTSSGSLAESRLCFPNVADTCGGVVLRLTPAERSLEPWDTSLAPLRAMCDIDPSLSRAGLEYRCTIHAVEGAHELKSHHHVKQNKARNAKAILGRDIRPRTSEPRLRISGVTSELDVLKTILVRERLIVTLRRLIRRIRRHCSKLQDLLRREIRFRGCFGKPPPEVLVCATQSTRKTLHTEQQELRVVFAHLRAISIDTVKAISEWRATFETSKAPGYRQICRNASAPGLHCEPELQEHNRRGSAACYGGRNIGKVYGHQNDIVNLPGGTEANQQKGDGTKTQHPDGLGIFGRNSDEAERRPKTFSRQANNRDSSSSPPTIFLWKGHNYLVKMAHDLDFLDDENVAAPIPVWLGFSVHRNPFLVPPEGHDICETLQRGHEERCKEIAARRRQRQQQKHRSGGTGNGRRRSSRSRSRSRANSGTNRQRRSGDRGLSASCSDRLTGQGQENDSGCDPGNNAGGAMAAPEATAKLQWQQFKPAQRDIDSKLAEYDVPAIALPGGDEGGDTFVTEGGMAVTDGSPGSASTSVERPLLWDLGDLEDEDFPCELSSGEEEEVQWNGGGYLAVPIIPELPKAVRFKASAAAETLRSEDATEKELQSNALETLANAKRTREILNQPDQERSSRVEWLVERSSRNGLRGALMDRHVGATRLKSAASASCWRGEPLVRRVSTAPAGAVQRTHSFCAEWAVEKRASSKQEGHGQTSAAFGASRGGVCVSVDGGPEDRGEGRDGYNRESVTHARSHRLVSGSRNPTSRRGGASISRLRCPDRAPPGVSEGSTSSVSATSLADRSMAASSLQASSSSMSARARARATATRPTAMRRPFCRDGGKIIIVTDPGKSPEVRHKAAMLIQAALYAACARRFVRRLRENRESAALLIGQNWRRSRVRLRMWHAQRLRRADELRQVAEGRARNRAAHLLQTFFRDIKYRRKRDRHALAVKNRDRIAREVREQNAALMVQVTIRRCIAFGRVKRMRHRHRGQAQAIIARAARQRGAYVRQKKLEDRQQEEENASAMARMRGRRPLRPDKAATRVQAWLRGVNCRRTTVAAASKAKEPVPAKVDHPPVSKSAHLQAALDALREAHSAIQNADKEKGRTNQDLGRRPTEDKGPRARKGVTDTGQENGRLSPNADELRWEARVWERKHTPARAHTES